MQKKIFVVYRQGSVTDQMCQKWFVKFRAGDFSLDNGPWLHRPAEVNRDQSYTMQEIADILNIQINKVIGENEKCVFYFTEKTKQTYIYIHTHTYINMHICTYKTHKSRTVGEVGGKGNTSTSPGHPALFTPP